MLRIIMILGWTCFLVTQGWSQYTPTSTIQGLLNSYRGYSNLTSVATDAEAYAVNITTWQMPHGGFSKAHESKYLTSWNGKDSLSSWYASDGTPLGMYDNNATVSEIRFLANQYKVSSNATNKAKFKTAVSKAVGFILVSQHASGSWPQVYPKRGGYSDMATYNDNAMVRLMVMIKDVVDQVSPFDSDIISATQRTNLSVALTKSLDYALKAQIKNGSTLTVWCQQHDPVSFAPVGARAYELPSKSGSESIGIIAFLMNWPDQTAAVQASVNGAVAWYKATRVPDMKFSNGAFVASPGASMWYRFYEVENDQYFFCDRAGISTKTQDFSAISEERRTGYQWAGDYGSKIIKAYEEYAPPGATPIAAAFTKHGAGGSSQTVTLGSPIVDFWFSWEGALSISVAGVVAGVTAVVDNAAKSVTFSGTPTVSGTYTYSLTTVGGTTEATRTGTITVTSATTRLSTCNQLGGKMLMGSHQDFDLLGRKIQ